MPAVSLTVAPATAVVPLAAATKRVAITVDLLNSRDTGSKGTVTLRVPDGWNLEPSRASFTFARRRRASLVPFRGDDAGDREPCCTTSRAVATVDGRDYAEGFEEIDFRDLEARYLYRPSTLGVRGIDVTVVPGLQVGLRHGHR